MQLKLTHCSFKADLYDLPASASQVLTYKHHHTWYYNAVLVKKLSTIWWTVGADETYFMCEMSILSPEMYASPIALCPAHGDKCEA